MALKMMQPQPQGSLDAVPLSRASRLAGAFDSHQRFCSCSFCFSFETQQKQPSNRATEEQSQGEHVQRARPIQKNGATAAQQKLAGDICEAQASSVFEDDSAEVTTQNGFSKESFLRVFPSITWHVQPCVKADSSG